MSRSQATTHDWTSLPSNRSNGEASGDESSVLGGKNNEATGEDAVVSGGQYVQSLTPLSSEDVPTAHRTIRNFCVEFFH